MGTGVYDFVTVMNFDGYTSIKDVEDVMVVSPGTTLQHNLEKSEGFNGRFYKNLRLCCHGTRTGKLQINDKLYGVRTVKDDWGSVNNFFHHIVILGCTVAYGNDGKEYCTNIARETNAVVFASDDYQRLEKDDKNKQLRMTNWNGKVWGFNPNGSSFRVPTSVTKGYI